MSVAFFLVWFILLIGSCLAASSPPVSSFVYHLSNDTFEHQCTISTTQKLGLKITEEGGKTLFQLFPHGTHSSKIDPDMSWITMNDSTIVVHLILEAEKYTEQTITCSVYSLTPSCNSTIVLQRSTPPPPTSSYPVDQSSVLPLSSLTSTSPTVSPTPSPIINSSSDTDDNSNDTYSSNSSNGSNTKTNIVPVLIVAVLLLSLATIAT